MCAQKNPLRNGADKRISDSYDRAKAHAHEAVHAARETFEDGYADVRDHAAQAFSAAQDSGRAAYEEGAAAARDAHGRFEGMVQRNPTTALLGAAGVGLLLGLALKARK